MTSTFQDSVTGIPVTVVFDTRDNVKSILEKKYDCTVDVPAPDYAGFCLPLYSVDTNSLVAIAIWIDSVPYIEGGESESELSNTIAHEAMHAYLDICDVMSGSSGRVIIDNTSPEYSAYHFGRLFSSIYDVVEKGLSSQKNKKKEESVLTRLESRLEEFYTDNLDMFTGSNTEMSESTVDTTQAFEDGIRDGLHRWFRSEGEEKYQYWDYYLPAILHDSGIKRFFYENLPEDSESSYSYSTGLKMTDDPELRVRLAVLLEQEFPFSVGGRFYNRFCLSKKDPGLQEAVDSRVQNSSSPAFYRVSPTANSSMIEKSDMETLRSAVRNTIVDSRLPQLFNPGLEIRDRVLLIGGGIDQTNYEKNRNCIITLPLGDVSRYTVSYIVDAGLVDKELLDRLTSRYSWLVEPYND